MGEPEDVKIASTQKSLSSYHDPGWNDPPKREFSAPKSSTTPTKRLLNKRVAFPLNSTVGTSNLQSQTPISIPPSLPPPLSCQGKINNSPELESSKRDQEERDSTSSILQEDSLNEILANLEILVEKHVNSDDKSQGVKKRIEIMKTLLVDKKLDDDVHRKVLDLLKALNAEELETADKIHISLMMERGSSCASWLPGIRHLIFEMKSKIVKNDANSDSGTSLISTLSLE